MGRRRTGGRRRRLIGLTRTVAAIDCAQVSSSVQGSSHLNRFAMQIRAPNGRTARTRAIGSGPADRSVRQGGVELTGLVRAALVVEDHAEPVGGVDNGDQGDQRRGLVVVVVL